jgi:DNA-binding NtrC family response regulator
MCRHGWPGNVRELENVVERALIFAGDAPAGAQNLSIPVVSGAEPPVALIDLRAATREFERQHISKVLTSLNDDKASTAQALGIGLSSLYRKMEELGISKTVNEVSRAT